MSRLLNDIERAQNARQKADQEEAAQQAIPVAAKANPSVSIDPVAGDRPFATGRSRTDTGAAAERNLELKQAAARRMQRDADALEKLKRREEEIARVAETSKTWLEVEAKQLEQAQALEAEYEKAALAAENVAQMEEQARQAAEKRLALQERASELAQRLQQAEGRRAVATHAKLETEKALAVVETAHAAARRMVDEIRDQRLVDDAELYRLRSNRYRRLAANVVRGASAGLVLLAFALGVGVSALIGVWRSPSSTLATHPVARAGKSVRQDHPVLKMDRDADAFAARANKALLQSQKQ